MKGKKALKRALSLLVTVMMVATMMPVNSLAAAVADLESGTITATDTTGKDKVALKLMASNTLYKGQLKDGELQPIPAAQLANAVTQYGTGSGLAASTFLYKYGEIAANAKDGDDPDGNDADFIYEKREENDKVLADTVAMANRLFKDETVGQTIEVEPGKTFYLALKIDISQVTTGKGVSNIGLGIDFDQTKLSFPTKNTDVILNNVLTGKGNGTVLATGSTGYGLAVEYNDYRGDYSVASQYNHGNTGALTVGKLGMALDSQNGWYLPAKYTTWDLLFPIKADANASGSTIISISKLEEGTSGVVGIPVSNFENNNSSITGATGNSSLINIANGTLSANAIKVKFKTTPLPIDTITLSYATGGRPEVTFGNGTGKAPIGTIQYQVEGSDSWHALNDTATDATGTQNDVTGQKWTVGDSVFNALKEGKVVTLSTSEGASTPAGTTITMSTKASETGIKVKKANTPTATALVINYEDEEIAPTADYAYSFDNTTWTAGTGSAVSIASTILDADPAKEHVYVQAVGKAGDADNGTMPSASYDAVNDLKRPVIGAKVATDPAEQKKGNTKLDSGTLPTGTKYKVAAAEPAASAITDAVPTNKILTDVRTGDGNVYLYTPFGDNSFASKVVNAGAANGNDKGTITDTSYNGTDKVTITVVGDTFTGAGASTATNYTITGSTGNPEVKGVAVDTDTHKVVLTVDPTEIKEDETYTVAILADAMGENKAPVADSKKNEFKLSASGYNLSIADASDDHGSLTLSKTKIKADDTGDDLKVTVSGWGNGWYIDTVTAADKNGGTLKATAAKDTSAGNDTLTFILTPNAADEADTKAVDVSITLKKTVSEKGVTVTAGGTTTKTYDETTDLPGGITFTTVPTGLNVTGGKLETAGVGTPKIVNLDVKSADGSKTYPANAATAPTVTVTPATMATASGAAGFKAKDANMDDAREALLGAEIVPTISGVTKTLDSVGTLSEIKLAAKTDADINALIQAAVDASADCAGEYTPVKIEKATGETIATLNITDTIAITGLPADATNFTIDAGATAAGYAVDADGVISTTGVTAGTTPITITLSYDSETNGDAQTATVIVSAVTATPVPHDIKNLKTGKSITVDVKSLIDVGEIDNYDTLPAKVEVKLTFTKSGGNRPTPSTGGSIPVDTKGYGDASGDEATFDENGKIVELPEVTNVVKGAVFVGWSTNGTKSGIIDPETYVAKDGDKLIAVYDGYMIGNEKNQIEAGKTVTRAELVKMLVVSSGMYDASKDYGKTSFTDANNGWYTNYIACAEQSGKEIVTGYPDKTFRPNNPVTREEAAKFIAATFDVPVDEDATVEDLTDFGNLQNWAKGYVAALFGTGAIDGYPDGTYRGGNNINRDASAKMTNTFLGLDAAARESIKDDESIKAPFTDMVSKTNWAYADLIFASLNAPADYYGTETVIPER